MKTPDEIKKGLECCSEISVCSECPYYNKLNFGGECVEIKSTDTLAYIQQLENHIGELTEKVAQFEAAQAKWISVGDRLPNVEVLAANFAPRTYGYKEYIIGYVSRGTEPGKCYAESDYEILYDVTHWMPLPGMPEPPEVNA